METILFLTLTPFAIYGLTVCVVLFVECVAAAFARSAREEPGGRTFQIGVVVPAHNEQLWIYQTVKAIVADLKATDRLLVVADNCDDDTAELATMAGAEVIQRFDTKRVGKSYALAFAVEHLANAPPDIVLFVDADCRFEPGSLNSLAHQSHHSRRPAQACYLMQAPSQSGPQGFVSAFAFQVKNQVRPLGLSVFGLPCHLAGSGMAFPWECLHSAPLATGEIVEDLRLGLDLTIADRAPVFCRHAKIWSWLPQTSVAARSQRTRWEHGHVQMLLARVPRLIFEGFSQRRVTLLVVALDLAVPPLALLALLITVTGVSALLAQAWVIVALALASIALLGSSIAIAWLRFARETIPLNALLSIPLYVVSKLPIYSGLILRRQSRWVRTKRDVFVPAPRGSLRQRSMSDANQRGPGNLLADPERD